MSDLIQARKDAIARGDMVLAAEIHHHLIRTGYTPEQIDGTVLETTQAPELHKAVKPVPRRRPAKT